MRKNILPLLYLFVAATFFLVTVVVTRASSDEKLFNPTAQTCEVDGVPEPGPCANYGGEWFISESGQIMAAVKQVSEQAQEELKQLEVNLNNSGSAGEPISSDAQKALLDAQALINAINAAKTPADLPPDAMANLAKIIARLEQYHLDTVTNIQNLTLVMQIINSITADVRVLERQVNALTAQNIAVPTDVITNLTRVKTISDAVKKIQNWKGAVVVEAEELPTLVALLNQSRFQLEMLARWPQTLKRMNSELALLDRELKKSKIIVDKLAAKGLDLAPQYAKFEEAVNQLKALRDEAVIKIKIGDDKLFDNLEANFFGRLAGVYSKKWVIDVMNNINLFAPEYKIFLSKAQSEIKRLDKQKVDTREPLAIFLQAQTKGDEILVLIKAEIMDVNVVITALEEFEVLRQAFFDKVDDLTCPAIPLMPWETGPSKIRKIHMPDNFKGFVTATKS